ncbi:MAG: ImmA/IrrE family metallo-endopeptidase [Lachnospiraceae bacterium]|nr:ImmA/IrrE family metallo-endopeptidase [Lachnospiraceae bacterium]
MDIERLRKIIAYSEMNRDKVLANIKEFRAYAGMSSDEDVRNALQIVRAVLKRKGFLVFEIPVDTEEIGAMCYKSGGMGYIMINSSLPKVNVNFAICHEACHAFYQEQDSDFRSKAELMDGYSYEHEREYAANLFAGMFLMPEANFRYMYEFFRKESEGNEWDTILRLMNYYQMPYMAVLIRCYELGLPEANYVPEAFLQADREAVRRRFMELWLDEAILLPDYRDDFFCLERMVEELGREYILGSYINERTLSIVLRNMKALYHEIKGA